jgi:hypothetical protein
VVVDLTGGKIRGFGFGLWARGERGGRKRGGGGRGGRLRTVLVSATMKSPKWRRQSYTCGMEPL